MTKHELIELGLKGIGKERIQGDTTEPAMPFLLADIMFQHYEKATSAIYLRHDLKRIDGIWRNDYKLFNRPFFSRIPDENKADLTDMMDDLTDKLSNEIMLLRANTISMFDGITFEQRKARSTYGKWFADAEKAGRIRPSRVDDGKNGTRHYRVVEIQELRTADLIRAELQLNKPFNNH